MVTFIDRRPSEAEEEGEVCGMKEIELSMSGIMFQDTVNITKQPVQVSFNVQIYISKTLTVLRFMMSKEGGRP